MSTMSAAATPATPATYTELLLENARLRSRVAELEQAGSTRVGTSTSTSKSTSASNSTSVSTSTSDSAAPTTTSPPPPSSLAHPSWTYHPALAHALDAPSIFRYSRQLLLNELGQPCLAQRALLDARVLVIGAGGLGAPVCLYLAASGVGCIGIVDPDVVDRSNLHRQVIHTEASVGEYKAVSARDACQCLNSSIHVHAHCEAFSEANALTLASSYDVLVDCTDNVPTRYLINDAGVLLGRPIVSGSALRLEGQCTVYHFEQSPCYRCIYPVPPPAAAVTNCSDGGVLGAVTGVVGSVQSLEVLKVIVLQAHKRSSPLSSPSPSPSSPTLSTLASRLLLFDAASLRTHVVRLRPRNPACAVCGESPTITREVLEAGRLDYQQFCRAAMHDRGGGDDAHERDQAVPSFAAVPHVSVRDLASAMRAREDESASGGSAGGNSAHSPFIVLDVRERVQYEICALPGSCNVPVRELSTRREEVLERIREAASSSSSASSPEPPRVRVFCVCRRGIDSLVATSTLAKWSAEAQSEQQHQQRPSLDVVNVRGGLVAWSREIDPRLPLY